MTYDMDLKRYSYKELCAAAPVTRRSTCCT